MVLLYIFINQQISEFDSALFTLDSVYSRYQIVETDTVIPETLFVSTPLDTSGEEEGFRISGAKELSFDIKEGFDQGMKVNIRGEVEGVTVEGDLSDKATSGSTVQLSDVEKMSLKVSTKNFYGALGDLSLPLLFGITDEIQGGRLAVHDAQQENFAAVAYAVNRGEMKRIRFNGEEGKQSPYFLGENIIIGSEKVYLTQGVGPPSLLVRDDDYNIDYETGILSFTNKNIITNHSRIEVEYQEAVQDYQSIYTETDAETKIGDFVFAGMYRRISDEKETPLSFTFTPAEIESLKNAGDSATVMHTFADTSSEGDYIFEVDHFTFVGQGNGDYRVTFFYVGENKGEYIYDPNIKAFAYQGPGAGNYSPTKYIPLPVQDEFYGFKMEAFNALEVNVYGSEYDRNTFSNIDDHDNHGNGYRLRISRNLKSIYFSGEYLLYDDSFIKPTHREDIDYYYQWNTTDSLQEMGDITLGIKPAPFLNVETGYGVLNREHRRKFITIHPFFFNIGYEEVDTLRKYFIGLLKKVNKFFLSSQYENSKTTHLFNYGFQYFMTKTSRVGVSGSYDKDTSNTGITTICELNTPPFMLSLGHRLYNDTIFLFGDLRLNVHYRGISLSGDLQQSQRYSQKRDETYIKVEEGKGNYVYDPVTNTYIEKEGGDYIKKSFLLQDFERIVSRSYSIETRYTKSIFDVNGRFYYVDERNFSSNSNDVSFALGNGDYEYEISLRQDITEDARYLLYSTWTRERFLSFLPSYRRFSGRIDINETVEKYNDLIREKRNAYGGNISYRIFLEPLIRPLVGYSYSRIFSDYFEDMNLVLHTLKTDLLFGFPIKKKGRAESDIELVYRKYNTEEIPYFFTAAEPSGLTRIFRTTISFGISDKTVFSLIYKLEFPPEEDYRQTLRFQTKIIF